MLVELKCNEALAVKEILDGDDTTETDEIEAGVEAELLTKAEVGAIVLISDALLVVKDLSDNTELEAKPGALALPDVEILTVGLLETLCALDVDIMVLL